MTNVFLVFGIQAEISIYDMVKSKTEYDDIMRCYKNIISQLFSSSITFNLGISRYHEGD